MGRRRLREGRDAELLQRLLRAVRRAAALRRPLRGARQAPRQPRRLHRPLLARRAAGRAEERRARSRSRARTGGRLLRRPARTRPPALPAALRLPDVRAAGHGRARGVALHARRTARTHRPVRLRRRRAAARLPRTGSGQRRGRRAGRRAPRRPRGRGLRGRRPGALPRPHRVLPVRGQHGHLRARRLPQPDRGPLRPRRDQHRRAALGAVPGAEHARGRAAGQPRRGLARVSLRQWRPVRRPAAHSRLHRIHARTAARRLPLRLVEHLARHLRLALPVRDGAGRAPPPGRALHQRTQHPQGHPAALPRRPAGRIRAPENAAGQPPSRGARGLPPAAGRADLPRPRLRLRQLPHHRLPRAARPRNRGAARTAALPHGGRDGRLQRGRPHARQRRPVPRHRDQRVPRAHRRDGPLDDGPHHEQPAEPGVRRGLRAHPPHDLAPHPARRRPRNRLGGAAAAGALLVRPRQSALRGREGARRGAAGAGASRGRGGQGRRHARLRGRVVRRRRGLPAGGERAHRLRGHQLHHAGRAGGAAVAPALRAPRAGDRVRAPHLRVGIGSARQGARPRRHHRADEARADARAQAAVLLRRHPGRAAGKRARGPLALPVRRGRTPRSARGGAGNRPTAQRAAGDVHGSPAD